MALARLKQISLIALLPLLVACHSPEIVHSIDGNIVLMRGSQPSSDDIDDLAETYGVRTIINLRPVDEGDWYDWYTEEREAVARHSGMHMVTIDLGDGHTPPTPKQISDFAAIVEAAGRTPAFVHCQAGIHRTGTIVAMYRILAQDWDPEWAIREMESYGFDWDLNPFSDRDNIKEWLRGLRNGPGK